MLFYFIFLFFFWSFPVAICAEKVIFHIINLNLVILFFFSYCSYEIFFSALLNIKNKNNKAKKKVFDAGNMD